jgi:hypothetical protein
MTSLRNLLALIFSAFAMNTAFAADFSTPENAVHSLEAAYLSKDMKAALAARDFTQEAKLLLQKANPEKAPDASAVKKAAEELEKTFQHESEDNGFPDFKRLKCSLSKPQNVDDIHVKLTETCIYPDGGKSVDELHVFKNDAGWHVVALPE